MKLMTLLLYSQAVLAAIALGIIIYKYLMLRGYSLSSKRPIRLKLVGFYDSWEMTGSSSELRRGVMQRNNRLSAAFWACVALIVGLAILEARIPQGL